MADCPSSDNLGQLSVVSFGGSGKCDDCGSENLSWYEFGKLPKQRKNRCLEPHNPVHSPVSSSDIRPLGVRLDGVAR